MAYITKRGNSYSVRYTYQDEHGKSYDKWESFPTKEEATNRKKQIEHELAAGTFLIPSTVTVGEFLMDWLPKQCSKHKWAPKTYESNLSTIQNLIIPYIGSMEMQKLKPYHMENLYTTLSKTPCGSYIEGKKQELTEKQKQRFLSGTTIHEVHRLLGTAFQYAVEWGILVKSPVPVDSPKKSTQERTIWTVEEMRAALDSMEDPILHLAVHLTLVGALREGEVVGLTPEDLDFDAADGIGTFRINKSMQRVRKEALNQ
ncbi:MAG: tyrosine-type recombinase/integrase family protein, partial [Subdoligranulum variabile]|nr:tyrosine-type recombinase/integrase family protein [Subdoligranulum variabile]MBS7163372.1 tyrosine-type recombinase/integrase family protein [Faecalibacterium prausnitzii]